MTGTGSNWTSGHQIQVELENGTVLATTTVKNDGTFTVPFTIPTNAAQGNLTIDFVDATGNLGFFIPVTFTVTPQIVSFTKAATPTVAPGGKVNYILTLTNTQPAGSVKLHDITLTDTPPSQFIVSISAPSAPVITPPGAASVDCSKSTTHALSCFVDDFLPGGKVTITFTAEVLIATPLGTTITNMATAQSFTIGTVAATGITVIAIPTPMPKFTPEQKKAFLNKAFQLFLLHAGLFGVSLVGCFFLPEPIGLVCDLTGFTIGALIDRLAEEDLKFAEDAPDMNFKVIVQPAVLPIPKVKQAQGFTEREENAVNALDTNLVHQIALGDALLTSIDRAQGASVAGNKVWEAKQLQAAKQYAAQLAELVENQPGLQNNVENALEAGGMPTIQITADEVRLVTSDPKMIAALNGASFPHILVGQTLTNSILQGAKALEQFAGCDNDASSNDCN